MSEAPKTGATKTPRSSGPARPKVPPFARYRGTSAWRKDRKRVRAYALYQAETKRKQQEAGVSRG